MPVTLMGVALMYAGLGTIGLGAISLLKPLAFLAIRTRLAGGIVIVAARKSAVPDGTPGKLGPRVPRHSRAGL